MTAHAPMTCLTPGSARISTARDRRGRAGRDRAPRPARPLRALGRHPDVPALDADEILDALADDVMAEGDLAEALRRLMERGWRTGDPTGRTWPGCATCMERLAAPARGAPRALPARRRPRRHPARARRDRRRGAGRRRAAAGRRGRAGRRRGAGDRRRPRSGCCATSPRKRLDQLDALPADVGERIRGLEEYDFLEPEARERFDDAGRAAPAADARPVRRRACRTRSGR